MNLGLSDHKEGQEVHELEEESFFLKKVLKP